MVPSPPLRGPHSPRRIGMRRARTRARTRSTWWTLPPMTRSGPREFWIFVLGWTARCAPRSACLRLHPDGCRRVACTRLTRQRWRTGTSRRHLRCHWRRVKRSRRLLGERLQTTSRPLLHGARVAVRQGSVCPDNAHSISLLFRLARQVAARQRGLCPRRSHRLLQRGETLLGRGVRSSGSRSRSSGAGKRRSDCLVGGHRFRFPGNVEWLTLGAATGIGFPAIGLVVWACISVCCSIIGIDCSWPSTIAKVTRPIGDTLVSRN